MCSHPVDNKPTFQNPVAKGFWIDMGITREQIDITKPSYSEGSYAVGDDIMAGMVLTKGGKLDYPKPPPRSLSIVSSAPRAQVRPPAPSQAATSVTTSLVWALLGMGVAVLMAVVIAPESDYFVGNVMIFVLASVLGYCLVMNVKSSLHTPLMSMSNAISGIVVLGGMVQVQGEHLNDAQGNATQILGAIAAAVSAVNVAGGFAVTFRMLAMFKKSNPVEVAATHMKRETTSV